jgi:hypothetical protein
MIVSIVLLSWAMRSCLWERLMPSGRDWRVGAAITGILLLGSQRVWRVSPASP